MSPYDHLFIGRSGETAYTVDVIYFRENLLWNLLDTRICVLINESNTHFLSRGARYGA